MHAIVFDLDGTLLDTRERIFWQFETLTKEFDGASATREEIAAAMHGTADEVIRTLIKNEDVSFGRLQKRYDELRDESLQHLRLYDGTGELLPILRRIGVQLAAVTSGDEREMRALEHVGIRKCGWLANGRHVAVYVKQKLMEPTNFWPFFIGWLYERLQNIVSLDVIALDIHNVQRIDYMAAHQLHKLHRLRHYTHMAAHQNTVNIKDDGFGLSKPLFE